MYKRNYYGVIIAKGSTLVELLIVLTINIILLALLSFVFLSLEHQRQAQQAIKNVHAHASTVLQILHQQIQLAGFIGCPQFAATLGKQIYIDTNNVLTVQHRSVNASRVLAAMTRASVLYVSADERVNENDILLISDCRNAEIFVVKRVFVSKAGQQRIITQQPLMYRYAETAEVGHFEVNTYAVKKTERLDQRRMPIYGLYMTDIYGNNMELVEGIESLGFSVDIQRGDAIHEVAPSNNIGWSNLHGLAVEVAARDGLLSKTEYGFTAR